MLDLAILIPRVVIGLLFAAHGAQKLFGWFGGYGIKGTAGFFQQVGLRPGTPLAVLAGGLEFVGGLGLAVGLLTPVAAVAVSAVMLTAIAFVHLDKGLWNANGGYEYNLALLAIAAFFGLAGAGGYALDSYLGLALPNAEIYAIGMAAALVTTLALRIPVAERVGRAGSQSAA